MKSIFNRLSVLTSLMALVLVLMPTTALNRNAKNFDESGDSRSPLKQQESATVLVKGVDQQADALLKNVSNLFSIEALTAAAQDLSNTPIQSQQFAFVWRDSIRFEAQPNGVQISSRHISQENLEHLTAFLIKRDHKLALQRTRREKHLELSNEVLREFAGLSYKTQELNSEIQQTLNRLESELSICATRCLLANENLVGATAALKSIDKQIRILENVVVAEETQVRNPQFSRSLDHLMKLKRERSELTTKYVDGSVWMKRIEQQIHAATRDLESTTEFIVSKSTTNSGRIQLQLQLDRARSLVRIDEASARKEFVEKRLETILRQCGELWQRKDVLRNESKNLVNGWLGQIGNTQSEPMPHYTLCAPIRP